MRIENNANNNNKKKVRRKGRGNKVKKTMSVEAKKSYKMENKIYDYQKQNFG